MWRLCTGLTVVFLLAACTTAVEEVTPDSAPVAAGDILRVALENSPISIDPRFIRDDEGEQIVDALFDPLVRLDRNFRIVPAAAESWVVSEDGLRYVFTLRAATFHDGTPVLAQDFVRSFNAIADGVRTPKSYLDYLLRDVAGITAARRFGAPLSGVRAVDERTLELTLRRPRATFLTLLSDPSLVPLPRAADTNPEEFLLAPIGNGPFQMVDTYETGSFIRLARFEAYHTPARVDEVIFSIFADDPTRETQWRAFTDRQIHVAFVPPQRRGEALRRFGTFIPKDRPYGVHDGLTATVYLYAFDASQQPFDDVRVRQAVSLAIDRTVLAQEVMGNTRVAATSYLPASLPGALTAPCNHCVHDPVLAAELFAEALEADASDEPIELTLLYPRGAVHTLIGEQIARMIEEALPIVVRLRAVDLGVIDAQQNTLGPSAVRIGWRSSVPDAAEYFEPLFGSDFADQGSVSGVSDPTIDDALALNRSVESAPIRQFLYQQLERQLLDDAIVLPLLWYRQERIVATELDDVFISPSGRLHVHEIAVNSGS
jgi:oligopeptide transport system substrate-binding protein